MTAHLTTQDLNRLHRHGAIPLTPATGMTLLDTTGTMHDPHLLATHTNTAKLRVLAANQQLNPLWQSLVHGAAHRPTAGTDTDTTPIAQRLAGLTEQEQHHLLVTIARTHTGIVLAHETPEAIDPDTGFLDLGLDSLTALELRNRLTTATGIRLPATVIFDHPTPAALAEYLLESMGCGPDTAGPRDGGGASALAEFERAAALLHAAAEDDSALRAEVTARLRAMLASYTADDDFAARLDAVSADDILDVINQEFGRTPEGT
jgi:acyl carrier protein